VEVRSAEEATNAVAMDGLMYKEGLHLKVTGHLLVVLLTCSALCISVESLCALLTTFGTSAAETRQIPTCLHLYCMSTFCWIFTLLLMMTAAVDQAPQQVLEAEVALMLGPQTQIPVSI